MSEELQQKLRDQLWEVANRLRGNMSARIPQPARRRACSTAPCRRA